MAYQPRQHSQFEFDLTNTNDTTYEDQPLAYHDTTAHAQSLQSPVTDAQMMSHGEGQAQYRKDSFANSAGVLSPANSLPGWESKFSSHGSDHVGALSAFRFDSNTYVHPESSQYFNPGGYLVDHSDTGTPATFDGVPQKFEQSHFPGSTHIPSHQSPPSFTPIQRDPSFNNATHLQAPMSPHSQEEWEAWRSLEKEGRAFPTHLRINSPPKSIEKRRGDGVRKKNAKIDIPDGRTVPVIEELMAGENDELMLKELKGQKRLLRNREAALASRQRKKKHTEDLEVKVNGLNQAMANMEMQVHDYARQVEAERAQRQFTEQRLHEANVALDGLRQEKEHMVIQHTHATTALRQRIRLLEETMASPAPPMSAAPSSTGYTDINSEMDHFNLGGAEWDKNIRLFNPENEWELVGEFPPDATIHPSKLSSNTVHADQAKTNESDQHIPTGVLFMLLLCGAFVAANSASKTPVIPRMPDDVRAVSDTVLSNLLNDMKNDVSNKQALYDTGFANPSSNPMTPWAMPMQMPESSTIANMHMHLTSPTKRQLAEQVSMLTPEQYNSLTQPMQYPEHSTNLPRRSAPKRNLAEILNNMRRESIAKGSNTDVYTRSLLWDQVPEDVIKQFKRAVQDSKEQATSNDPGSGTDDYKTSQS